MLAIGAFLSVVLFSVIPVFLARFGVHFLPSAEWVSRSHRTAIVLGWLLLVSGTLLVLAGAKNQNPDGLGFKWIFVIPFSALLFHWIGYVSLTVGVPLAAHVVLGKQVTLTYEIDEVGRLGDSKCRRPIEIKAMPLGFNKLCGFPQDVRDRLRSGDRITVKGRGTGLGLFPEEIVPE